MKERDLINRFPVKGEPVDYGEDDYQTFFELKEAIIRILFAFAGIIIGVALMGFIDWLKR